MYHNTGSKHDKLIFWGIPVSAWSGKVRAYLIKSGADYEEHFPVEPRFAEKLLPLIGYFVVPALELTDGTLLQDSTETIRVLESMGQPRSLVPPCPIVGSLAWLLNFFGSDGFFKPGMHYRWSFPEANADFIKEAALQATSDALPMADRRAQVADLMSYFGGYCERIGIYQESIPAIESSFMAVLDILNRHLGRYPYLLGGLPSVADCGFMVKFYAHLSRDPYPSSILKTKAHNVFRWTERMMEHEPIDGAFYASEPAYFKADALPDTLLELLRYLSSDYGPELKATLDLFDAWVAPQSGSSGKPEYPEGGNGTHPVIGDITYELCGKKVKRQAMVDTVFQYQEAIGFMRQLSSSERRSYDTLLKSAGWGWITSRVPARRIAYNHYSYVLA